jgi:hypothetical protein
MSDRTNGNRPSLINRYGSLLGNSFEKQQEQKQKKRDNDVTIEFVWKYQNMKTVRSFVREN